MWLGVCISLPTSKDNCRALFAVDMGKHNHVKKIRKVRMMSKAELVRRPGVSINTIIRIEKNCRVE